MGVNGIIQKAHSAYYYCIPAPIWKILDPIISPIIVYFRNRTFDTEFRLLKVSRLKGKSKFDGSLIAISILGGDAEAAYYAKTFFSSFIEKKVLPERVDFSNIDSALKKEFGLSDIVIIRTAQKHENFFWKNGFVVIPDQVSQSMGIPNDFSSIEKRFKKIIKEFSIYSEIDLLETEISKNPSDLGQFIDEMYIPSAKKRFNDTAFIYPKGELDIYYRHGTLLFIKNNGVRVAGTLLHHLKDKIVGVVIGVKDGDEAFLRSGYLPYMYFESIRFAHSKKFKKFDLGHAKPFVMDGVLRFKKKIGAVISMANAPPIIHAIYFPANNINKTAQKLIEENAFISVIKNKLVSVKVFSKPSPDFLDVVRESKKAAIPGVIRVILFAPSFSEETKKNFAKDPLVKLIEEPDFFSLGKRIYESA